MLKSTNVTLNKLLNYNKHSAAEWNYNVSSNESCTNAATIIAVW